MNTNVHSLIQKKNANKLPDKQTLHTCLHAFNPANNYTKILLLHMQRF